MDILNNVNENDCGCGPGSCSLPPVTEIERRGFLKVLGAGAAVAASSGMPVMAGPFEDNEYLKTIPIDKRLDPVWLRSLKERGAKETYTDRADLERIGMPVGGFFAGTVYLSGDGRLWLWDIFNKDQEAVMPREAKTPDGRVKKVHGKFIRGGLNYVHPAPVTQPFEVGFDVEINGETRSLDADGFSGIEFDGRYPIGRVAYRDEASPVTVDLEGYSPFIPLKSEDSSLPATVMSYTVTNESDDPIDLSLSGRMANPVCLNSGAKLSGERVNRVVAAAGLSAVECFAQSADNRELEKQVDFGQMVIALLDAGDGVVASASSGDPTSVIRPWRRLPRRYRLARESRRPFRSSSRGYTGQLIRSARLHRLCLRR